MILLPFRKLVTAVLISVGSLWGIESLQYILYDVNDGLPTSLTKSIYQDDVGFIWIATDNGLVKFSGDRFEVFRTELNTNYVKKIVELQNRTILVIHDRGIHKINNEQNKTRFEELINGSLSLTHYTVNFPKDVYEDADGGLWISEPGSVVFFKNGKITRHFFDEKYRADDYNRSFFIREYDGITILSSQAGYLFYFDKATQSIRELSFPEKGNIHINTLFLNENDELWAGTSTGIYQINKVDTANSSVEFHRIIPYNNVSAISSFSDNLFLAGSWTDGLVVIQKGIEGYKTYPYTEFPIRVINQIVPGRDKNTAWVSTDDGIALVRIPFFSPYQMQAGRPYIQYVVSDNHGVIYATDGQVVNKIHAEGDAYRSEQVFRTDESLILSILPLDNNNLMLGYRDNYLELQRPGGKTRIELPDRGNKLVRRLLKDHQNQVWICQDGLKGIYVLNKEQHLVFYGSDQGLDAYINSFCELSDTVYYVAGEHGTGFLYKYTPRQDSFIPVPIAESIELSEKLVIYDMIKIDSDRICLGTNYGLYDYIPSSNKITLYAKTENLVIKAMALDEYGNLWAGTDFGVLEYNNNQLIHYEDNDGLPSLTVSFNSLAADSKNRLWVGTSRGLAHWQGDTRGRDETQIPQIISFRMNGNKINPVLAGMQDFPYGSYLECEYFIPAYPQNKVIYQVWLEGYDSSWTTPDHVKRIFYPKLKEGEYHLRIRAKQSGHYYSPVLETSFSVQSPWYQSVWVYILVILLMWFFVITVIRIRREIVEKKYLEKLQHTIYKDALVRHDVKALYDAIYGAFYDLSPFDSFTISMYKRDMGRLTFPYHKGGASLIEANESCNHFLDDVIADGISLSLDQTALIEFIEKRRIRCDQTLPQYLFAVPLMNEEGTFGAMVIESNQSKSLTFSAQRELKNMEYIARHIAQALSRIEAETALSESEEKLRALINAVPEYIIFKDADQRIIIANRTFLDLIDKSFEEVKYKTFIELADIVSPRFRTILYRDHRLDQEIWAQGSQYSSEITVDAGTDGLIALDIAKVPLYFSDARRKGMVLIGHNITQRKESELMLQEALENARIATRAKGEFLANMSHEIRTPLNGMIAMSELLTSSGLDDNQLSQAEIIRSSADYLLKIVNEILDFSKIESGKMVIENISFDLGKDLEQIISMNRIHAENKGLALRLIRDPKIPNTLSSDQHKIKQIIVNLLNNAIKFTESGEIVLTAALESLSGQQAMIHLSVADTGIGIPSEKQNSIFDVFTQTDNSTTRRFGGTGLGLSITFKLVKLLGGTLWVESPNGIHPNRTGTTFHLQIPFSPGSGETPVSQTRDIEFKDYHFNILVVDDNKVNQKVAESVLKRFKCELDFADNGTMAVEKVLAGHFDIVLMDLYMPDMDGFEATQIIRSKEGERKNFIVGMTASVVKEDIDRSYQSGMNKYLPKPVKIQEMAKLLAEFEAGNR